MAGLSEATAVAVAANPDSMDPFSPQAQNQLAEFDLLRSEIEGGKEGEAAAAPVMAAKATNGASNGGS